MKKNHEKVYVKKKKKDVFKFVKIGSPSSICITVVCSNQPAPHTPVCGVSVSVLLVALASQ